MNFKTAKLAFIGAGNVATRLALEFKSRGLSVIQIYSKTQRSALELASKLETTCTTEIKDITQEADIYFVCVPDKYIEPICAKLPVKNKLVVHTAGSVDIETVKEHIPECGVFYPMQTFSKFKEVDLNQVPIFIEASSQKSEEVLYDLGKLLSHKIYSINSEQRKSLHISAVFACNFSNHMYSIAEDILQQNGIPFEILKPLIKETSEKIQKFLPKACQTGPAVREDMEILENHEKILAHTPYVEMYKLISESIINLKNKP